MTIIPSLASAFRMPPNRQRLTAQDLTKDGAALAQLIVKIRKRSGLSRAELARRLGVKPSSLKQYENGRRGRYGKAGLRWFVRLAEGCGCEVSLELPGGRVFDMVLGPASLRESTVLFIPRR